MTDTHGVSVDAPASEVPMQFKYLDFVVTGCPRSGTQYAARALESLGLSCHHEVCFNPWSITFAADRPEGEIWGDASWLAVPFLTWLPAETKVIHLVRDPVRTINSILGTGQLDWPTDYRRFLVHHFHGDADYWPDDVASFAQQFWVGWNTRIEATGRVALRLRIEDFGAAAPAVVSLLQPGRRPTDEDLACLDRVPRSENSRPYDGNTRVDAGRLTREVRALAGRYGYRY